MRIIWHSRQQALCCLKNNIVFWYLPNLLFFYFSNNTLKYIPKDLCEDMPKLIAVDLGDNKIQTLAEESVSPIFKQPLHDLIIAGAFIFLIIFPFFFCWNRKTCYWDLSFCPLMCTGNPLHCDCKLRFLRPHVKGWRMNRCATPPSLKGHHLKWLTDAELKCWKSERRDNSKIKDNLCESRCLCNLTHRKCWHGAVALFRIFVSGECF